MGRLMPATSLFWPYVMADSVSSVLEVQPVKVRAVQPAVASLGQIHGEIHVSPQGPEAGIEETLDGVHVAGHWGDRRGNCERDLAGISRQHAGQIAAGLAAGRWTADAARPPWVAPAHPQG